MTARVLALLAAAAVAVGGCGRSGPDRPELPARIALEGPAAAQHVGLYVAAARGYDEAEGVTIGLVATAAPAAGPRLLRSGRAQLAVLDVNTLAREREAGSDLVGVMAIVQRPVARFASRALGRPVDVSRAPRYPELVLAATRATVTTQPSLIRAAVAAIRRGYEEELLDPEATADVMLDRVPRLRRAALIAQLTALDDAFTGPDGRPGTLDRGALEAWSRWAPGAGVVRRAPDVARAFAPTR